MRIVLLIVIIYSYLITNAQMSGIYTVGGTSPDFNSIDDALNSLKSSGINDDVILNLRNGIYYGMHTIKNIPGLSDTSRLIIQSELQNQDLVILTDTALGNTNLFMVNNSSHIVIQYITFKNNHNVVNPFGIYIDSICNNISINQCTFDNNFKGVAIYKTGSGANNLSFSSNIFKSCAIGINFFSSGVRDSIVEISNNSFKEFTKEAIKFSNSAILSAQIINNNFQTNQSSLAPDVMIIKGKHHQIIGNSINVSSNFTNGINLNLLNGDILLPNTVANNFVYMEDGVYGILISGSSAYVYLFYNSVNLDGNSSSSAISVGGSGGIYTYSNIYVLNNIGVNSGLGYAFNMSSVIADIDSCDYNNFKSYGTYTAKWRTNNHITLNDWTIATGHDVNSYSVNPMFTGLYDLHACNDTLKNKALFLSQFTYDIDSQPRSVTPDIGADEFKTGFSKPYLGEDTILCEPYILKADSIPGVTYLWNTSDNTPQITISQSGIYIITIANACEGKSDTINVTIDPVDIELGDIIDTCISVNGNILLTVPDNLKYYNWSTGDTSNSILVSLSGSYFLEAGNESGCSTIDTVIITLNAIPAIFLGNDTTICLGSSIMLDAGNGFSQYNWSTGDTSDRITVTEPNTYSVMVKDSNQCENSDEIIISLCDTTTGIINHNTYTINIYPTINDGNFYIRNEYNEEINSIRILNMNGQKVLFKWTEISNQISQIELLDKKPGFYILQAENSNLKSQIKLICQ